MLRDLYNQCQAELRKGNFHELDAIQRRLLLAEKGDVVNALRKRIVSKDLVQPCLKNLDEKLLRLENK